MNAGDLRHRITLSRKVATTPDAGGQVITSYEALGNFYALVERKGAGEIVNANQKKGLVRYRVTLRASAGPVFPTDRISWNGHLLNVDGAVPDPFNIYIEVDATEIGQQ